MSKNKRKIPCRKSQGRSAPRLERPASGWLESPARWRTCHGAALASFTSLTLLYQIADKWTALILSAQCPAPLRFDVRETGAERRLRLPRTLGRLERHGIVEHRVVQASPIAVVHAITPLGQGLVLFFQALDGVDQGTLAHLEAARAVFDQQGIAQAAEGAIRNLDAKAGLRSRPCR